MSKNILIVGASGLVGTASALEFCSAGYNVLAVSRRTPELLSKDGITHVAVDLQDSSACEEFVKINCGDISHLVYTAVYEMPGLIDGWTDKKQIEVNGLMLKNILSPMLKESNLEHVTLLQGTKAYGLTVGPIRAPARESQSRVDHPNFYWVQEDFLKEKLENRSIKYTINWLAVCS